MEVTVRKAKFSLLFSSFLLFETAMAVNCSNFQETGVPQSQCDAVVALYNSTNGNGWTCVKTNWMSNQSISTWVGVTVHNSTVTKIDRQNCNMVGVIPSSISSLQDLVNLNLSFNKLIGSIPSSIGSLAKLTQLYLHSNQLSGSIPASIGSLGNLWLLWADSNNLSGSIPSSIGNLQYLSDLRLSTNQLSGIIPSSMANLNKMEVLELDQNKLTGAIPSFIGNFIDLRNLELSQNEFSGSIPQSFANLAKLNWFQLGDNNLSGNFPSFVCSFEKLRILNLKNNQLSGKIPECIGNLNELNWLFLANNNFHGDLTVNHFNNNMTSALVSLSRNCLSELSPDVVNKIITNPIGASPGWFYFYNQKSKSECPYIEFPVDETEGRGQEGDSIDGKTKAILTEPSNFKIPEPGLFKIDYFEKK
jgi:Leucine-rich repeat (LRR) protein